MNKYGVPTAKHLAFENEAEALTHVADFGFPVVLKLDGLAGGKGVVIASDQADAEATIKEMFADHTGRLVIEECLVGPEYSMFVLIENGDYQILPMAQDHKRAYDGDKGPNTCLLYKSKKPASTLTRVTNWSNGSRKTSSRPTARGRSAASGPLAGSLTWAN